MSPTDGDFLLHEKNANRFLWIEFKSDIRDGNAGQTQVMHGLQRLRNHSNDQAVYVLVVEDNWAGQILSPGSIRQDAVICYAVCPNHLKFAWRTIPLSYMTVGDLNQIVHEFAAGIVSPKLKS